VNADKTKNKICKNCQTDFRPYKTTQKVCSMDCAIEYAKTESQRKALKDVKARQKVLRNEWQTDTIQTLANTAQIVFNTYIRKRDAGKCCVSCLKPFQKDFQAGHFYSAGKCWALRFSEINVFGQCIQCNKHEHGNENQYRKNILLRITPEQLEFLDNNARKNADFTREFLFELIQEYKKKTKELK